ncbi:nucleotidyltransferase family protein [Zobellia barbeyronii]|uniref:Nucleotidyltransferase family protein n=1 Tax=Zobellia barbeyronii TaxID=2748009 RepID=A0ABS5WIT2_9FLAO|nr:nucleotidyltransferase family protein [Zobellia barbeyronii]MBT2162913.1 nucleotidyltransferase family protein [Zobellia barbeyronii]
MKNTPHRIAILILAAGASTRMGKPKQLLPWKDTTLLEHAIKTAKSADAIEVVTVLGANTKLIQSQIKEEVIFIENTAWQLGLGGSIAFGTKWLLQSDIEFDGILIMLADQPLIDFRYLNTLIATSVEQTDRIIATAYKNRAGVPTIFPIKYVDMLLNLNEDFGAKHLLEQERDTVITVSAGNRISDVDTEEDYKQLKNKNEFEN